MRAARSFAAGLDSAAVARVQIELYGSLGLTGRGHGTDRAVILGLLGEEPDLVDPAGIEGLVRGVRENQRLALMGAAAIPFEETRDLLFRGDIVLPGHPNGMRFTAFGSVGAITANGSFFSASTASSTVAKLSSAYCAQSAMESVGLEVVGVPYSDSAR